MRIGRTDEAFDTERWCVVVLAQFPPRLLLAGAVVTALTASGGIVLLFPTSAPAPQPTLPAAPADAPPAAPAPVPVMAPAPTVPPAAGGADIAALATAPSAPPASPRPVANAPASRRGATPTPTPVPGGERQGLSEADWARLPPGLRERVRIACARGELSGPHCEHA